MLQTVTFNHLFATQEGYSKHFKLQSDIVYINSITALIENPVNCDLMLGNLSLLLNNRNECVLQDYPILFVANVSRKILKSDEITVNKKHEPNSLCTLVFKSSDALIEKLKNDPAFANEFNLCLILDCYVHARK
jgi:hypothetical protein